MNYYLHIINWIEVFNFNIFNINECVHLFYCILYDLIDLVVPKIKFKRNAWYSIEAIYNIIEKKKAHVEWLKTSDPKCQIEFKRLRAKCIIFSRKDHKEHMHNIERSLRVNSRAFWRHVNSCRKFNSIPTSMSYNNTDGLD